MNYVVNLLQAIVAIDLLVLLHEFGHMATAKLFRVKVHRFSVGIGPRLIGFRYGGTQYRLGAFPIGGYVQMAQAHHQGEQTSCLECVSSWKRILIYFAGPFANLLTVFFVFWVLFSLTQYPDRAPVVSEVVPGSSAGEAGLVPGDRIVEIDGQAVTSWSDIVRAWKRNKEEPLTVILERPTLLPQNPAEDPFRTIFLARTGYLGIHPSQKEVLARLSPWLALQKAWEKVRFVTALVFESLLGLVTSKIPPSELVGPVYLFHISSKAAATGPITLLYFMAFISASLFLFNLLPLPVLDGGQIVLTCVQKLLRRPLRPRSLRLLTRASIVWLLLILASATFNDIVRLVAS